MSGKSTTSSTSPTLAALLHLCKLTKENNELQQKIYNLMSEHFSSVSKCHFVEDEEDPLAPLKPVRATNADAVNLPIHQLVVNPPIHQSQSTYQSQTIHQPPIRTCESSVKEPTKEVKKVTKKSDSSDKTEKIDKSEKVVEKVVEKVADKSDKKEKKQDTIPKFFDHAWSSKEEEEAFMREFM